MGKGEIISGGTNGQYQVKLNLGRDRTNAEIIDLTAKIADLTATIAAMDEGQKKEVKKLEKTADEKRKTRLGGIVMPGDPTIGAWCADLTEDLSGDVGTIEVPGERGAVNIHPGYDDAGAYDEDRDGQLFPAVAQTPAQCFFNLAMLPGWQKWKPTFRYGTITAMSEATCSITLDDAESSQQELDINDNLALNGVGFDYMDCDQLAFEVGDKVLVKFEGQDRAAPKVVGFKDNPAACSFISIELTRGDETHVNDSLLSIITVADSAGTPLGITYEYNAVTQYYDIMLNDPGDADDAGYFIFYNCIDGISTQYPLRYKTDDMMKPADLIAPGTYEGEIPYWKIEPGQATIDYVSSTRPWGGNCWDFLTHCPTGMGCHLATNELYIGQGKTFWKRAKVYSSIPYRVVRTLRFDDYAQFLDVNQWDYPPGGGDDDCNSIYDYEPEFGEIGISGGALAETIHYDDVDPSGIGPDDIDYEEIAIPDTDGTDHDIDQANGTAGGTSIIVNPGEWSEYEVAITHHFMFVDYRQIEITAEYDY